MNLEALPKYYSPKSPKLSDDAPATGSGGLTITDVMAAQGMVQSKAPLGFALFLAKVGVQDPQFAIEGLLNYAMALDNPTLNKLSEETRLQIIPYLVNFAFADYSRSAASKARCEHCAGTGFHNVLREVVKHSRSGESVIKEEWVKELCQHCHGKGEVSTACRGCKGKGIVLDEKRTRLHGTPVYKAYTAQGLLSGIFRQDERRLGIEYDHHNRPETLTDVMGREHHTEYSGHDLPVKMRGPGGQSVRLQWQQHHKLSGIERAGTGAEGFRYDRHGNLLAYTDGNGVVWTMEYGPFDLPVARTDGEGHRWQYRYDKDTLQLTEVINPQGRRAIEYHYPDEHTVIRCILPPEDERDRHPDESLLKTTYRYNAAGELTEVILPGDETLTFSRDEAGREVLRHSNRGFACEQGWNAAGRLPGSSYSRRLSSPSGDTTAVSWFPSL